jgi:CSLREA domain-containing protein
MFTKISRLLSALLIGGMLLGSVAFPTSVRADSTITVNTTDDELNTDGDCSLREAIQAANTNAAVDACTAGSGADTITVPAGTYTLTITGADEDANATGDLDITDSVTINGAGKNTTIIQAGTDSTNGIDRVLHSVSRISATISDVTIANGRCESGGVCRGGGILNVYGTLTVTNTTFSGNSSKEGGGIYNHLGTLTVTHGTFTGNAVAGITNFGTSTVRNSLFSGNPNDGIHNFGHMTVMNSSFSDNGLGFLNVGTLIVMNSIISDNQVGGILNWPPGTLIVTNSTFLSNTANTYPGNGGGILNNGRLTVTNSTFSGNTAMWHGGGIYNDTYGTLTVTNSTFSGNHASRGGGIYNSSILTLSNSILANTASDNSDCYNYYGTVSGSHNLIETDASGNYACGTTTPIHSDPNLGPLANNGGPTQTFALLPSSLAIDAGNDAICAASPMNNTSQNGVTRPQGIHCDIGSFEAPVTSPYTFRSIGENDGWLLESTETSSKGGAMNSTGQAIAIGDDAANKQYRSILHFDIASLPNNAVITKVTLMLKKKAIFGTDPFTTHKFIKVDIRNGGFSNNTALQLTDFQGAASKNWVGTIKNNPVNDWYSAVLNQLAFPFVNLQGATQFRLYFALDDDNDKIADYIQFFSGDASATSRPQLIIEYTVP